MKYVIAGTAGHIDHGKTALVRALTGIDTDRLEEEKRRGISIDLGFAHLDLPPGIRVGLVDVPGHERFVKNMLAGVGGIDLVLLVVSAVESIQPQTREHFDICRLLGMERGIVALTKADLASPEVLEVCRQEVRRLVAGSFLETAPMVPVSAVTGSGLDGLRRAIATVADRVKPRNSSGHFRLPVDRVFAVRGFGTVVTGTLVSGSIGAGDEVEAYPLGLRLRVRGVEVHGSKTDRAVAGQRTALNLAKVEASQLHRGVVLSAPGLFQAVSQVDCRLQLLSGAGPLKHRAPVHFHAGTAEIEAEARLLDGAAQLEPGGTAYARLMLREPALLLPGDSFVIRRFSPVVTIGGGVVVDATERRHRRGERARDRLHVLAGANRAKRIELLVRESPFGGAISQLVAATGLTAAEIRAAAAEAESLEPAGDAKDWYLDRAWREAESARLADLVRRFHHEQPMLSGIALHDLRAAGWRDAPDWVFDAVLAGAGEVEIAAQTARLRGRAPALAADEIEARETIERAFRKAGLAVPAVGEVLAGCGLAPARARTLLEMLLKEKRLVRVDAELIFHAAALEDLCRQLAARRPARFTLAAFKEWTGVSRKYAIPLLEYLDRHRVTRREGNERLLL
ncbi:MAG: selenocysteine-specific translation elongation factor [Bryobacteraceae bacterium]|jgi:selenocysteine-specific elongation factor